MFASIDQGQHLNNAVAVAGYVVMRIAMGFQWLRAATQDPERRSACLTYLTTILVAQVGWVLLLFVEASVSVPVAFLWMVPLTLIELAGPWIAETRKGGTPWHAHHIAERYGLLAIIALGEGVIGTVASLAAVVERHGWSVDAVLVGVAGTGLTLSPRCGWPRPGCRWRGACWSSRSRRRSPWLATRPWGTATWQRS